jgi:hypothetical protein
MHNFLKDRRTAAPKKTTIVAPRDLVILAKMASKTPQPFAKVLLQIALARQILIMVMTTLSYALAGCLQFIFLTVLEL